MPNSTLPILLLRAIAVAVLTVAAAIGNTGLAQIVLSTRPIDANVNCSFVPTAPNVTATGGCGGAVTVVRNEQREAGSCAFTYVLVRTWTATDPCGTTVTHVQRITVSDTQAPIIAGVPANVNVALGNLPAEPVVKAIDFCDANATLTLVRDSVPGACGGYAIIRNYTASDACGNVRTARYIVSVSQDSPPVISGVTPGATLSCGAALPAPPAVTATDVQGPVLLSVLIDTLRNLGGDTCKVVRRTWSATDNCGLVTTAAQRFVFRDGQGPSLTGIPANTIVYCEALPSPPVIGVDILATDNCDPAPEVVFTERSEQTANGTCSDQIYRVIRTWTARDECGNVTTRSQVLDMKCECCSNGIDDDDDGLIDDYDPQCNCFAGVEAECDSTKRYYVPPVLLMNGPVYNGPSEIVITTLAPQANIHITTADGTTYNASYTVNKGTPLVIPLTTADLQTAGHDRIERDKGWVITSDQLIQPIYRIDGRFNKVLVTLKGPQALGRVFRAGSQTYTCGNNNMSAGEGHFISVMATEDDTDVTIDFTFPALGGLTGPITRRLNRHETYLIRDDRQNSTVSGSLITSTKPIAVISGSQHTKACKYPINDGGHTGGMDGGIDQLVPNCLTGSEYVLVRGKGNQVQQYAVLVANKNNTRVVVNGDTNNELLLQAGEHTQVWLDGNAFDSKHFIGNKDFYAYHVAGISTNNEVGMAICGPVGECKGDTLIEFPKFNNSPTGVRPENIVYVIVPTAGLPTLRLNDQLYSTCTAAKPVPGRPDLSVVTFPNNCLQLVNKISCDERFTAGMMVGISGDSGTHGYLTSFKDRMEVRHPRTNEVTTAYFVDTLCGSTSLAHCIDVSSCATTHNVVSVRASHGTVTMDGGTCLTYTAPDDLQGLDQVLVTVQNDQGLFQTVCLSYFVCSAPPEIQFPFTDTTVTCEQIPPVVPPLMSDECGQRVDYLTADTRDDGGCDFSYVITRRWAFWDECGDSTHATQIIRVIDTSAPQAINLPNDTIVSACNGVPPVPQISFRENCDTDYEWSFRQETVDSTCSVNYTIVRTWEAWDECNNRSTAVQRIQMRDTAAPILSGVPVNLLLACGQTAPPAIVTASDDCDPNPLIVVDSIVFPRNCDTAYHVVRRWTATDLCGQQTTATQRILLLDTTPPQILSVPADTAIACGQPLPTTVPQFVDDCFVPPVVYVVDSVATGTCPIIETIYRTWTITDGCGQDISARQVISITDSIGPVFVPLPDTIFASCADSTIILEPTVLQACGVTVTAVDSMASGPNCNGERLLYRTFTATDNCARTATYRQLYYFQDAVPPVWRSEPTNVTLSCEDAIPSIIDPNVADACSGFNPVAVVVRDSSQVCPATRWIIRDYTVSDWCGNLSYFTHLITIIGCEPVRPVLATGQAGCTGEDITLTVTLDSGYVTPVYQWQFSADGTTWTPLGGVIADPTYSIPNADPSRDGVYRVNVANNATELGSDDCSTLSNPIPLTIRPHKSSAESIEICRGDTLFYLGDTLTQNTQRTDRLQTYYGCDSVVTLTLTVYPFVHVDVDTIVCFGESLTFLGKTYASSGTFTDTLVTAYGCDSTLSLKLVVLGELTTLTRAQICTGETYAFADTTYATSGTYVHPYTSLNGCDSTQTLVLQQVNTLYTVIDTVVCEGGTVGMAGETFATAGSHVRTLRSLAGCDSVVTLNLVINIPDTGRVQGHVCFGEQYFFGTQRLDAAGVYYRTLRNRYGCDSTVQLTLRASPRYDTELRVELCQGEVYRNGSYSFSVAGRWPMQFYTADGCDSTVNVTLVYRRATTSNLVATICAGESYPIADTSFSTSGRFVRLTRNRYGCDSTITLDLTVVQPQRTALAQTLCFGESFVAAGRTFSTTTRDSFLLKGKAGCDSLVVVDVFVRPNPSVDTVAAVCFGESLTVAGRTYTTSGKHSTTLPDRYGCDSTWTLYLSVYPELRDTLRRSICAGDSLVVGNRVFTQAGRVTLTYPAANFCDSTVVLELEVRDTAFTLLRDTICEGTNLVFGTDLLTTTGEYRQSLQTVTGCDSTVILHLYVHPTTYATIDTVLCVGASLEAGGETFSTAGTYERTIRNAVGCDSVLSIELRYSPQDTTWTQADICEGERQGFYGSSYTASGDYFHTVSNRYGCDSTLALRLTVHPRVEQVVAAAVCAGESYEDGPYAFATPGRHRIRYTTVHGCDSVILLDLRVLPNSDTTINGFVCAGEGFAVLDTMLSTVGTHVVHGLSANGCDSMVTVVLDVIAPVRIALRDTLCAGDSVEIGGRWINRTTVDSVSLSSAVGCDSVIVFDVFVRTADTVRRAVEVCFGESYTLAERTYTASGRYVTSGGNQYGCDSTHVLDLVVLPQNLVMRTEEICAGDTLVIGDYRLTRDGQHTLELSDHRGCDSTIRLDLSVWDTVRTVLRESICSGERLAFGDQNLMTSGIYERRLQTVHGCDSVVVMELTVLPTYLRTMDTTVCAGTTVSFGSRSLERVGRYVDSLLTQAGCDSVVVLNLRHYPTTATRDTVHVCEGDGIEVGGVWQTQAGNYTATDTNQYGCDSVHTTKLIVHPNVTRYDTLRICHNDTVTFDGRRLAASGTYVAELKTDFGCDSTVVLELYVTDEVLLAADDAEICAGSSVSLQARGYRGPVRWSPAEGLSCVTCPNPIAKPLETTTYTVSAADCSGRMVSATARVRVRQPVQVKIVSKRKLRLGESTTLKAVADDPMARMSWREGNTVLCDACDEIEVRPLITTVYEVQASNGTGCDDTERLTLIVEDECSFADIEIPNIITPNDDGANDFFEIRYSGLKDIILLRVYNRWGETVYETTDIDKFWDGTHRGIPLNPGVFMYYMEGHCLNDEPFTEEGNVTLIR